MRHTRTRPRASAGICGRPQADGTICANAAGCQIPHPPPRSTTSNDQTDASSAGYGDEETGGFDTDDSIRRDGRAALFGAGALPSPRSGRSPYTHPVTGRKPPSVTEVLSIMDRPALKFFAVKQVAQAAVDQPYDPETETVDEALKRLKNAQWGATVRGTAIHEHLESDTPLDEMPEDLRGFVAAGRDCMATLGLTPVAQETVIWGDDYAGRVDMIAVTDDERLIAVDWKSTNKDVPQIYPDARVQVAAYALAEYVSESGGVYPVGRDGGAPIEGGMVISINEHGRWAAAEVETGHDTPEMRVFRQCQELRAVRDSLNKIDRLPHRGRARDNSPPEDPFEGLV